MIASMQLEAVDLYMAWSKGFGPRSQGNNFHENLMNALLVWKNLATVRHTSHPESDKQSPASSKKS